MSEDADRITGPQSLNALAQDKGWGVFCDASCRFMLPELDDLLALWRSKAGGGIPRRTALTPRLLKPYMRILTLHERVIHPHAERCYRIRVMGDAIAQITGAASGMFYDAFLPEAAVPKWNAMNDAVLGHGGPLRMLVRADSFNKSFLTGEFFAAPLRMEDDTANLVLTAGRFDARWRWADVTNGA
jgi:PAS domain